MAKKITSLSMLDVLNGISTVVSKYGRDGALDADGEPIKIGLKREIGNPINDSRVVDGFSIRFGTDKLILTYQSEIMVRDVYKNGFEDGVEQTMADIIKFIKREYKKMLGKALSLTPEGETEMHVESSSRVRTWVRATRAYTIKGLDDVETENEEKKLDKAVKNWLTQETDKKPENVTIKKGANEGEELKRIIK